MKRNTKDLRNLVPELALLELPSKAVIESILQQLEDEKTSTTKSQTIKPHRIYCVNIKDKQTCTKNTFSAKNITLRFRLDEHSPSENENIQALQRLQTWKWIAIKL